MVDTSNQPVAGQQSSTPQYDWQNPNLKKFDFGRVMSRTFQGALHCGKESWLPLLLWFGLPMFIVSLWPLLLPDGAYGQLITGGGFEGFEDIFTPAVIIGAGLAYLVFIAIYMLLYIALSHNVYGFFNGSKPSFQESFRRGRARFWTTLGSSILFLIGIMLGFLLLFIPGIILMLGWYLMGPVLAMEDKGPAESLGRSWEMSRGSKRWILLLFIILSVISAVIGALFSIITVPFGNQMTAFFEGGSTTFWVLYALATALSQIIAVLLSIAGIASVYYEIRDVKEGAVQETLSAVFD